MKECKLKQGSVYQTYLEKFLYFTIPFLFVFSLFSPTIQANSFAVLKSLKTPWARAILTETEEGEQLAKLVLGRTIRPGTELEEELSLFARRLMTDEKADLRNFLSERINRIPSWNIGNSCSLLIQKGYCTLPS